MNRIVVYTSKTGFTARYAKWIAEELQCEAKELKTVNLESLKEYDQVIYGGWIMGSMVSGLHKVVPLQLTNLVVFGSGMSAPCQSIREMIANQNKIDVDKFFYFEGGYEPKRVGFIGKLMIKMVAGSIRKKENKTPEELRMLETAKGADRTDRAAIADLVEYVKKDDE